MAALFAFSGDEGPDAEPFVMLAPGRWRCTTISHARLPTAQRFFPSETSRGAAAVLTGEPDSETDGSEGGEEDGMTAADAYDQKYARFPTTIFKYVPA